MPKGKRHLGPHSSTGERNDESRTPPAPLLACACLLEHAETAVMTADERGLITFWNRGAERLFGYPPEEIVGKSIDVLVPTDLRARHRSAFAKRVKSLREEGAVFTASLNVQGLTRSGETVPVEMSITGGRLEGRVAVLALIQDVREHRALVERLNDALHRLRFHVERMPLASIVWDLDLRATEWNPAAERLFGYTKEEALGRDARDLIVPAESVETVMNAWAEMLGGAPSCHLITRNVRKDGTRLTCEWFCTPLQTPDGTIHAVASMAMDVSEREALEAQIRDAQKLESLGILAGGVAHDFNSALMVILGNTSLLRSLKDLPPRALEYIKLIEEAGTRAEAMVRHLLAYARTGKHNPQPVDLNQIIRDTLKLLRSSLRPRHDVETDLQPRLPRIQADPSQIEQVVLNLSLNARQAMPDGGLIRITTRRTRLSPQRARACVPHDVPPGEYVELVVSDTGCGMDEQTRARIFDPFFTTRPEGHGLGLAAVLGILRQHNGAICAESAPGQGTAMHVYLPVRTATVRRKS